MIDPTQKPACDTDSHMPVPQWQPQPVPRQGHCPGTHEELIVWQGSPNAAVTASGRWLCGIGLAGVRTLLPDTRSREQLSASNPTFRQCSH